MERFLKRHQDRLMGSIAGSDRILFRGVLRSICYGEGLNYFMGNQRPGFKDFAGFVEKFSAGVKGRAERMARRAKRPFLYVASGQADKEKLARGLMERDRIQEGLICVLSCVEPCPSFTVRRNREKRQLQLVPLERKCLHLYFYWVDRDFGLMHIRLQTWLPLTLQVCVKHRLEENWIKMCDKQGSVLRVETTLHQPGRFRVYRRVTRQGQKVKGWYPLRKGLVDLRRRVELSRAANARYLEALAVVGEPRPSHRILDPVSRPVQEPRRYRALRPISPEDRQWFAVLLRGEFHRQGVRNRAVLQPLAPEASSAPPPQRRQAAARITRQLRLLCAHGLIYRVGRTYYYRPTQQGYEVTNTALKFRETDFALLAA